MPAPTDVKTLRSFLGTINYLRLFINDYARRVRPLQHLLGKVPWKWTEKEQSAFDSVRESVTSALPLYHLDHSLQTILRTDASDVGLGGHLLQIDDTGKERTIGFVSKTFNTQQAAWTTTEKEGFAVVYCLRKFEPYLMGMKFEVQTDHSALKFIMNSNVPKLVRWSLYIQQFFPEMAIVDIPGRTNVVADTFSRLPVRQPNQLQCARVLMHENDTAEDDSEAIDVALVHNDEMGHGGIQVTIQRLRDQGYGWSGMGKAVSEFVASCPTCQKTRGARQGKLQGVLGDLSAWQPMEVISVDTIGPLPVDESGNSYAVIFIDNFTRYVEIVPTPDASAVSAARAMLQVFQRYGHPARLHSDQGTQFTAKLIQEYAKLAGMEHTVTLPYRPQANGIVERANGEIKRHLRALLLGRRSTDWSLWIPFVQRIINDSYHSSINTSPNTLMYGGRVQLGKRMLPRPGGVRYEDKEDNVAQEEDVLIRNSDEYLQKAKEVYDQLISLSLEYQAEVVQNRRKEREEKIVEEMKFKGGEYVLVSHPATHIGGSLQPIWFGPRRVIRQVRNTVTLSNLINREEVDYDISRLKIFDNSRNLSEQQLIDLAVRDQNQWVVESIVGHRRIRGKTGKSAFTFRVRWLGFDDMEDTWEPYLNIRYNDAFLKYLEATPSLHRTYKK